MRPSGWRAWLLAATAAVVGCAVGCGGDPSIPPACRNGGCSSQKSETALFQQALTHDIDVLFVVDDTPAIAARADALAAGYRKAVEILGPDAPVPGGPLSVHVAFVTASRQPAVGSPAGRAADCGVVVPDAFLATGLCGRMPNTTRPFEEAFACLAALGTNGSGAFEPLAAARRALDPAGGAGALAGFLRPHAVLDIFIVAGQDDASPADVPRSELVDFVQFLQGLKDDPSKVMIAVAGPPVECADGAAPAPAPRLHELVQAFGGHGVYTSLCGDDAILTGLLPAFVRITPNIDGTPCLSGVRDTDPSTPGLQPECVFEDLKYPEVDGGVSSTPVRTRLPDCDHGAPPCWRLTPSPSCRVGVELSFDRGPDWCPQDGLNTTITCLSCLHADDPACNVPSD